MTNLDRRTLTRAALWSAPAVVVVAAAPAFAASGDADIGAYELRGTCGVLGVLGPGVTLKASPTAPVPVGTTVVATLSGVANGGVFSVSGSGTGSVTVLSPTSRLITVTGEIPAGTTMEIRTTLSISVAFTLNAVTTLPTGFVGTGAKSSASISSTLILCSAT